MAFVQICGVVLLMAMAQSDGCYKAMKCVNRTVKNAVFSRNRKEICRLAPGIIACAERENAKCDNQSMWAANAKQIDALKSTIGNCDNFDSMDTITNTTILTEKECSKKVQSCTTHVVKTEIEKKNKEVKCTILSTAIACLEKALSMCSRIDWQGLLMSALFESLKEEFPHTNCETVAT